GTRRLHKRPGVEHVRACAPWLEAELAVVRPQVVVGLGATAAQALLGRGFKVTRQRGQFFESDAGHLLTATVHPSSILRAPDQAARRQQLAAFVADLAAVASRLAP
ncbi:MAG: uracil-DNA glycosylase family protein, partial [Acidimicrobiales bacterium]